MEEDNDAVNYVIPLAIGIAVMAACGVVGFTLFIVSWLVL